MKRFLAGYTLFALGIAAYAWQTTPVNLSGRATGFTPAPGIDDYAAGFSVAMLKALPGLLVVVFILWLLSRVWTHLRYAHADSAGRLPIPRSELAGVATEALAAYHTVELERARHQVPERLTYSPHLRLSGTAPAPAMLEEHTPAIAPTFAALLDCGMIGKDRPLLLGYTNGTPLQGSWRDLYSSAVAGVSGSGKTTTVRFLAAQAALHGARFAILDPHAESGDESLATTLSALQPAMLCEPAINERDMLAVVKLMQSQLDARLSRSPDRTPLLLAIDEYTRLMRSSIAGELAQLVEALTQEGRKVGIFCLLSGQVWTADRAGGTPLRDSLASCYVHRLRRNQARLLLSTEEARLAESLEPGRALLLRTSGACEPVNIPQCTASDVERIGYQLATTRLPNGSSRLPNAGTVVATDSQATSATGSHIAVSAEARQAADLFLAGNDPAAIVLQLRGIRSDQGRRYQTALGEVLELVRLGVRAAQERV